MKHLKDYEIIEKVTKENYSLKSLLDLYKSEENDPFFFKKRTIYSFLIISVIIFLIGVFLSNILLNIIGGVLSFYYFNYLGQIKGYHDGAYDGVRDGFDSGETYTWLYFLKSLIKYKERGNSDPEKSAIFLGMLYLSNKFEGYSSIYMDSQNKNLPKFKLKEIIDSESDYYWKYDSVED